MNMTANKEDAAIAVDIDELLQDTCLLVVELRQGASVPQGQALWQLCVEQVEYVRQQLKLAGLSQRNIDHISHAQCALLDETVLTCTQGDEHAGWASEPLQTRFFNRHQAGEFLYEEVREVLREPAPNRQVMTAFQRVLMLGFRGRYRDLGDPEREQLLLALSAQVTPLSISQSLVTQPGGADWAAGVTWLRSPLIHVVTACLLLAATWWGLDHLLSGALASLLPAQA